MQFSTNLRSKSERIKVTQHELILTHFHEPRQWWSSSALKTGRRQMPGSILGHACRPSRSEVSVVFSETHVKTGQDPLEKSLRSAYQLQSQVPQADNWTLAYNPICVFDINAYDDQDCTGIDPNLLFSKEGLKQSALSTRPRWNFVNRNKGKYVDRRFKDAVTVQKTMNEL